MGGFLYEDIDIVTKCASIDFIPSLTHRGHLTTIRDVTFRDVRIEGPGGKIIVGVHQAPGAIIRNITFDRLVAYGDSAAAISILGESDEFDVRGVHFVSCEMQDRMLTPADMAKMKTNAFAKNVTIKTDDEDGTETHWDCHQLLLPHIAVSAGSSYYNKY
eukprot:COSAG01_NODE_1596_length_9782_cov_16.488692_7_plen_160_part_00